MQNMDQRPGLPRSEPSKAYRRKSATPQKVARFGRAHFAAQIRAARAWLAWSQQDLARLAGVSLATVKRLEASKHGQLRGNLRCMAQILATFEDNGAMFIDSDSHGDLLGGVQFRTSGFDTFARYYKRVGLEPDLTGFSTDESEDGSPTLERSAESEDGMS